MAEKKIATIKRWQGLSTDTPPAVDVPEGSTFHVTDTGVQLVYYDGDWVEDIRSAYSSGSTVVYTAVITGAASNDGTHDVLLTATDDDGRPVARKYLYRVITEPGEGGAEPAAYTGEIVDEQGITIFEIPTRAVDAVEKLAAISPEGGFEPITSDWTITLTGIGEDNTVTVSLVFA